MNNPTILIIDDEAQIRKLLQITLQSHDYKVLEAATAQAGIAMAATHSPDLILLDLGLPDMSGHTVLQQLREWCTKPILILSVQSSETDIVQALDNGANDYLVKPFRTGELLARIRATLRADLRAAIDNPDAQIIVCNDLQIDLVSRTVKKAAHLLKLTATEYHLLTLLAKNEGRVLTHQYLLREIWGISYISQTQYLRVFVAQLRKKIEDDPNSPQYIITESGIGYRFQ
jgi:two-component system, OmpR family, KDP operon response regulator KdpE